MNKLYAVAHLCGCGVVYSHSQADCDMHRAHNCINLPTPFKDWREGLQNAYRDGGNFVRRALQEKLLNAVVAFCRDNVKSWRVYTTGYVDERQVVFQKPGHPTIFVWYPTDGRANDAEFNDLIEAVNYARTNP